MTTLIKRWEGHHLCTTMPCGVSNVTRVGQRASLLNIPLEEGLAIGDDINDIEMLTEAGIGVAVNNAIQCAKDASDHITEARYTSGVIEAIRRFS